MRRRFVFLILAIVTGALVPASAQPDATVGYANIVQCSQPGTIDGAPCGNYPEFSTVSDVKISFAGVLDAGGTPYVGRFHTSITRMRRPSYLLQTLDPMRLSGGNQLGQTVAGTCTGTTTLLGRGSNGWVKLTCDVAVSGGPVRHMVLHIPALSHPGALSDDPCCQYWTGVYRTKQF